MEGGVEREARTKKGGSNPGIKEIKNCVILRGGLYSGRSEFDEIIGKPFCRIAETTQSPEQEDSEFSNHSTTLSSKI